jgi:hypothetical protein
MDALSKIEFAGGSQSLADHLDSVNTALKFQCLSNPGVAIGSPSAAMVKIANTTVFTSNGEFKSKTTAEVPFTATTHDIPASASAVQEACYLLCLAADGTPSLVMGAIASGSGAAKWPDRPSNLTPIGGVRVAVAAGATSFDASTDNLSAGHITDTYYSFGYFAPRFDAAI